ncbi:hypothetical protein [Amycolatopsis sp. NPDC051903]|uniref:hypothetical protein n=1 Tax=Amycolatopsis sp. NPDC051903 TaxID=3363936 RepID=UPI00379B2D01
MTVESIRAVIVFVLNVERALTRMKCCKILRDYRRAPSTLNDTVPGIAHLHNILPTH